MPTNPSVTPSQPSPRAGYAYFTSGDVTPARPLLSKIGSQAVILLISDGGGDFGQLILKIGNKPEIGLKTGQIIFLPPGIPYCLNSTGRSTYLACHFNLSSSALQLIDLHALHALLPTPPADYARPACLPVRSPLRELQQALMCYLADGICTGHIHRLKAQELFYVLRHYYTPAELATLLSPIAGNNLALRQLVINHLTDYPSIDEWARLTGLSPDSFKRAFIKEFGMPVHRWLNARKFDNLYHDLRHSSVTAAELARRYHFATVAYLSTFCRKMSGRTPSDIRNLG